MYGIPEKEDNSLMKNMEFIVKSIIAIVILLIFIFTIIRFV